MKYGYARVSPGGKSESVDAQARQLTKAGCKKVFRDVHVSGAKIDRAQLRRVVDGREVRQRAYDFPISIGSRKWQQVTFFADNEGKNNAPFKAAMSGFGHATWSDFQIRSFQRRFDEYLGAISSAIARPK
jgi:hypothetical protein